MDSYYDLGTYSRPVTTSSRETQLWFDPGLLWCSGFNHEESMRCSAKAAEFDPGCAMVYWGIAYAAGCNYNTPWEAFREDELRQALAGIRDAMGKALAYLDSASPVERAFIDALVHRYPSQAAGPDVFRAWNDAYAGAMRGVYADFPDDLDVSALFAEALINRTPWKLWDLTSGLPAEGASTVEAVEVLEKALRRVEDGGLEPHPGLLHMYLHTMEMSPHPERAQRAGDALRDLVPDAGHLRHMPSHIDVLCGRYHDAVVANTKAIQVSLGGVVTGDPRRPTCPGRDRALRPSVHLRPNDDTPKGAHAGLSNTPESPGVSSSWGVAQTGSCEHRAICRRIQQPRQHRPLAASTETVIVESMGGVGTLAVCGYVLRAATRILAAVLAVAVISLVPPPPAARSASEDDLKKAVDAYSRGNLAQARIILEYLQQDPGPMGGRAAYLLGITNLQQRKFNLAEAVFSQAAGKLPMLADHAHYYRAVAAFHAGDYPLAVEGFHEVLTQFPGSTLRGLALFWEAESLWGVRSPEAPAAFHRYLEEHGQGVHAAQAWFDMGESLAQLGRWGEAAQAYRRVRWGFEGSPFWQPAWARLTALAAKHPLPPDATPPEVFYRRALADIGAGDLGTARTELLRVLSMPDGWRIADDTLYQLGVLSYQRGRPDEAAGYFRRDVALHAAHADDSLFYLERIALQRNREGEALALARELIRLYPTSSLAARSLYAIAEVREDKGALGPALGLYREAGERFPNARWGQRALWSVGWVHYRAREWRAARDMWLRMAQGEGSEVAPAAHYWAARAAENIGRPDLAQDAYRRLSPMYPDSYYGQRAAARSNTPLRATVVALPDIPTGELQWFDRFRELDLLAQIDDATNELAVAAEKAPTMYRVPMGALLSQRYAQQGEVGRGIAMAEQVRDLVGGGGRGLPLILWQALYPQAFWETITKAAARTGADPYLVAGVIREESRFDPQAVSPASAYGLMQLLPGTAKGAARLVGIPAPSAQGLFDPQTNILLGSVVLQELWMRYNRVDLALAAYNAGPGAVGQWQGRRGGLDPEAFVEEIPYLETRNYVKTVMQAAAMYKWLYRDGHPSTTP